MDPDGSTIGTGRPKTTDDLVEELAGEPGKPARFGLLAILITTCAFAAALFGLFANVEVRTQGEVTRTCGSVFDSMADRSGWETWWALDVDDPDGSVRSALLRTDNCPGAINRQLGITIALAAAGTALSATRRHRRIRTLSHRRSIGGQFSRLGRNTSIVAAGLGLAGIAGIIVLIADADSTLFLYTDRVVVAVIGLVVLVPTLALYAIGRVLMLAGPPLERVEATRTTDDERHG
jgi:hypothetical protein